MEFLKEEFHTHWDFSYSLLAVCYRSSYLLIISQNVTYLTEYKNFVLKIPLLTFNISKQQQQFSISMIFSKLGAGCAEHKIMLYYQCYADGRTSYDSVTEGHSEEE